MLAALVTLTRSAAAVPATVLAPEEMKADGWGSLPKPTPRVAAAATACTYRNSLKPMDAAWCSEPKAAGWGLSESYETIHASGDTDNADLYRMGGNCMLTFHGADTESFGWIYSTGYETTEEFYNVTGVGLSKGLAAELEIILTSIREKYTTLAAWAATCPGRLHVAGHSMGGGMAAIFAFLANMNSDPLGMKKPVSRVFLFAPMAPATTTLYNERSSDGCFTGGSYYTRALAGVVPGFGTIGDCTSVIPFAPNMVIPKMKVSSIDMNGPYTDASNVLGTGLKTDCGSVPPVYEAMQSNQTLMNGCFSNFLILEAPAATGGPSAFGLHSMVPYILGLAEE
jgi:hypothetical protein